MEHDMHNFHYFPREQICKILESFMVTGNCSNIQCSLQIQRSPYNKVLCGSETVCCVVQCSVVQRSAVQCSAVLCSVV